MKRQQDFEKFARFMERASGEDFLADDGQGCQVPLDFCGVCGKIGVDPLSLGDWLMENFGFSGDEIVRSYRCHIPAQMA